MGCLNFEGLQQLAELIYLGENVKLMVSVNKFQEVELSCGAIGVLNAQSRHAIGWYNRLGDSHAWLSHSS